MNEAVETLVKTLIDKNLTISTMESCTGGGLANEITNIPGASEIFKFSAVTYSNEFKIKMGVSASIIDKFSVYSPQTAEEMSYNIAKFANSSLGVGITGKLKRFDPANNAGTDDLVHICVYDASQERFFHASIQVHHETRDDNKNDVISKCAELVLRVINNDVLMNK